MPPIGHALGLSEVQFGEWAAIAIHDTSSVVGAGAAYGEKALEVATLVKCTRALVLNTYSPLPASVSKGGV